MTRKAVSMTRWRFAALAVSVLLAACSGGGSRNEGALHPSTVPAQQGGGDLLAAGFQHSLGPGPDGMLLGWGGNVSGELGDGSTKSVGTPVKVVGLDGRHVVGASAGATHSLAVTSDGSVYAWGHNASGELGDGSFVDSPVPILLKSLHDVRAVAAGDGFSLALEADGSVWAWGNNQSGELGDGNAPADHASPAMVYGLGPGSGVVKIAAGASFALVLKSDGSVWAWGNGTSGQLGDGSTDKQSAPTQVVGLGAGSGAVAIGAGGSQSLALKSDGEVLAWGNNASGELGDGNMPLDQATPVAVQGLGKGSGVVAVAAGGSFDLALKSDGAVLAWGNNSAGELGDANMPVDATVPVAVHKLGKGSGVIAIAAGGSHCVALMSDGEIVAFGSNSYGQLGDGTAPTGHATPVIALEAGARP